MDYRVFAPARCFTTIELPASKSLSNRALVMDALCGNRLEIESLSDSEDTRVLQEALTSNNHTHDLRGAGTAMRFLTAYFAQKAGEEHILTGTKRMCERPIGILVEALRQLGADIEYLGEEGFPPLHIHGKRLSGGNLSLSGEVSSQYISALLLIAPYLQQGLTITFIDEIISRPYIDMTVALMQQLGIEVIQTKGSIQVALGEYRPQPYRVEADWSAASYWYEITALAPEAEVTLRGLSLKSLQGDTRIAQLFELIGVTSIADKHGITLQKNNSHIPCLKIDLSGEPDLAQTLAVTCCMKEIPFCFTGLQSLRIKETDRIAALQRELSKLGYSLSATHDTLAWEGEDISIVEPYSIDTYNDHRMAMAFAPAAFRFPGIEIKATEVVSKSYPNYWEHLAQAQFILTNHPKENSAL